MSKFNIGSLDTLADRPGSNVRDELIAFYRQHYSANLMSLAVLGREPLPQLKQWVIDKFSPIENRNTAALQIDEPLFAAGQLPARLEIVPIKDDRNLTLAFPVPSTTPYYRQKPVNYIANLLGHEGKGSLFSLLKAKGWADGIWAGLSRADERQAMATVSIQLTKSGLDQVEAVTSHVFQYLRLLRRQGITAWLFDEQKRLADIDFRFQEQSDPIGYVRSLAAVLPHYPPQDLLRGPYAMDEYDALLIRRYLSELRPDNVLMTVSGPGLTTDAVEQWFDVAYRLTPISAETQKRWQTAPIDPALAIAQPNQFIPDDITLKDESNATSKPMRLGVDFEFWYQQDDTYRIPRTEFYFTVRSPVANNSPRHAMLTQLYVKVVSDLLSEFSYPAHLAGLEYRIYKHIRGFTVRISGYSDKQPLLLERIMAMLTHPTIDTTRFELIKADLLRGLQNASQNVPYRQLISEVTELLIKPSWSEKEQIDALQPLNAADLERFVAQLLAEIEVVALANGNLDKNEAMNLAAILQDNLLTHAKKTSVSKGRMLKLEPQSTYVRQLDIDHDDSALVVYFQGDEQSYSSRVKFALLAQILESPFFEDIRTEKRLGYTVFSYPMPLLQVPGLMFVVQSPVADPIVLEQHVQDFIVSYGNVLATMSDAEFNKHKQALLAYILEKEKTLKKRSDRYWTEIDRKIYDFNSTDRMRDALVEINKDDIVAAYRHFLLGDKRRRLVLRSIGVKHMAVFTSHDNDNGEKLIIDPALFKLERDVFSG